MLTIFKSPVSGDVIMFSENGKEMLAVLGKYSEDAKGIVTVEQLPAAIATLKDAIRADKEKPAEWLGEKAGNSTGSGDAVRFYQRSIPFLEMLERSLKEKAPVTWGV